MHWDDAQSLIDALNLRPLGFEGGYFRETIRSPVRLERDLSTAFDGARSLHTAIYYLLAPDSQSLLHKLKADEVYHFYDGDPVDLLLLHPDGTTETVLLGPDLAAGQARQVWVPAGVWQGGTLRPGGRYALMGTTMSPGFERADFELGRFAELAPRYPAVADRIRALTPTQVDTPRLELRAATRDLLYAELHERPSFETGLAARVPDDWPPEGHVERSVNVAFEALAWGPEQRGWWLWYFIDRSPRRPTPERPTQETPALIGVGGFKGPPRAGMVEIGYGIVPSRRRQGLATEAVKGLIEHAAHDPRVDRVEAETDPDDAASRGVLHKAGFRPVAGVAGRRSRRYAFDIRR